MSSRSGVAVTVGAIVVVSTLVYAGLLCAQFPGRGRPDRRNPEEMLRNLPRMEAKGTVESLLSPAVIKMASESKQTWLLQLSADTKVEIAGKGQPDMLTPGTCISVVANVNPRTSRIEDKVGKVTIFVPSYKAQLGALPEQEAALAAAANAAAKPGAGLPGPGMGINPGMAMRPGMGAHPGARGKPGVGEADAPFGAGGAGAARPKEKPSAKARGPAGPESFEIRGRITANKNGKITLYAPNQYFKPSLKIELTEAPQIEIQIEALAGQCPALAALVRPGDQIEGRGVQVAESGARLHEVKITLRGGAGDDAEAHPKKGHAKPPAAGKSKKPDDADDAFQPKDAREKAGAKGRAKAAPEEDGQDEPADKGRAAAKGKKAPPHKKTATKDDDSADSDRANRDEPKKRDAKEE